MKRRYRRYARPGVQDWAANNREAARIIAASPARYAGLALDWARLVMEREKGEPQCDDVEPAADPHQ